MSLMFLEAQLFNQDIGLWNVSNVTTMTDMFGQATMFNQDISAWNVENVTNMDRMFRLAAAFNQDLSNWCVEQIENEPSQFAENTFENGNRPNWGASCDGIGNPNFTLAADGKTCLCPDATDGETGILLVNGVNQVFTKRNLTQLKALRDNDPNDPEIALTCTSGITDMEDLFKDIDGFNQDLSSWDVSNVTNMRRMFLNTDFNYDIGNWDVGNVTNMTQMFRGTPFNQPIVDWNVSNVTRMQLMFKDTPDFNQQIINWDVSSVTDMREMFDGASAFNQDIGNWNVSNVTNMSGMFNDASTFNQDIGDWDVSKVTTMDNMFASATSFNQGIGGWDVSSVTTMNSMFNGATTFDQDLSLWCVEQIASAPTDFATGSPLNSSPSNHPDWGATCATDIVYTTANGFQPVDPNNDTAVTYNLDVQDGTAVITAALTFGSITVRPGAVIDLDEDIIVIDEMLFESDASGSGQIADMTGVTITGDVRVQRYIPAKRAFRFLSSAVGGQSFADSWQQDTHITGAQGIVGQTSPEGLDYTNSGFASLFTYDVQNDDWAAVLNTKTTNLEAGTGYRLFVRGDRTIDLNDNNAPATVTTLEARGNLMVGDLTTGTDLPALSSMPNKFSLVGNPYQAVVDFSATDRTNLTDFIYVWDASIAGDNGNGGYVTVPLGVGPEVPSASDATKYLAPGQAIFVENTAAGNASIVFSESDKAVEEAQVTVFDTYADFFINSRLFSTSNYQNNDRESDAISIRFNQSYTTIASSGEDSGKLPNPGENYAVLNNGYRAIDNQNIPVDGHQIDLSIWNYQELDYTLTFSYENQPSNLKVYLHDTYLNTQTELTGNDVYSFTADANLPGSVAPTRFHLSFENQTLSNTDFALSGISLYPNPVQGELNINLPSGTEISTVKVFNTLGQQVQRATRSQVDMSGLTSGVYFVEITTNKGQHTQKVIKD
jgi:surface protein